VCGSWVGWFGFDGEEVGVGSEDCGVDVE